MSGLLENIKFAVRRSYLSFAEEYLPFWRLYGLLENTWLAVESVVCCSYVHKLFVGGKLSVGGCELTVYLCRVYETGWREIIQRNGVTRLISSFIHRTTFPGHERHALK